MTGLATAFIILIGIIVIISTDPTTRPSIVVDTPDSVCETVNQLERS